MYPLINLKSKIYINYYYIKNKGKKSILIYTDSRGFEITQIKNRKTPFSSYVNYFIKNFHCEVVICPEKHTTIFDFLYYLKKSNRKYDFIVSHVGVVDFSPRPQNDVKMILRKKRNKIVSVFDYSFYSSISEERLHNENYMGKPTSSILDNQQHLRAIAEKFNKIENLIWVSCNPVDLNWKGNYFRERPKNINMVNEKSKFLIKLINEKCEIINLTQMNQHEIHMYTCDNIHFTKEGMNLLENKIKELNILKA